MEEGGIVCISFAERGENFERLFDVAGSRKLYGIFARLFQGNGVGGSRAGSAQGMPWAA